jgi:uncharacterized membrane protein YfcA
VPDLSLLIWFPLLGAFAGLLAGMFGIGGGLVLVAALNWFFVRNGVNPDHQMHLALGTSLATIIVTSMSSIRAHHARGAIMWPTVRLLVPGILIGGLAGAWLAESTANDTLRRLFGVLVVIFSLYIVLDVRPTGGRGMPGRAGHVAAGVVIGVVAALAGIGGGNVSNPFFLWRGVDMRRAVATSAACTFPVALASTAGFVWAGWRVPNLPDFSTGFVYWPAVVGIVAGSVLTAPVGARIAHSIPVAGLRRAFAVLLIVVGLLMLFG